MLRLYVVMWDNDDLTTLAQRNGECQSDCKAEHVFAIGFTCMRVPQFCRNYLLI